MTEPESHAEEPTATPGEPEAGGSIFGNLPKERPGSRSPRRAASGAKAASKRTAKAKATKRAAPPKPKPAAEPREPLPPPSRSPRPQPASREQPMRREDGGQGNHGNQIGGIEDLAWAGVTVAAQAATVGVKLASRALEAVRKSVDRP